MPTFSSLTPEYLRDALLELEVPEEAPLALAVSGGGDSMCLSYLASSFKNVTALVVDHQLREHSSDEAGQTLERLRQMGLNTELLVWKHECTPTSNIQAMARDARYELMMRWCETNQVPYLLTAHHQDDQAETVLLRLARGSGVYGLAGMAARRELGQKVTLVRPLLHLQKALLIETLAQASIKWIEDPSNKNDSFDRVKVRRFLENPPLDGFKAARLADTATRLRRTRDALEFYEQQWLDNAVVFHEMGYAEIDRNVLDGVPEETILRGLSNILRFAGGGAYVPRFEKLERLLAALRMPDFNGYTLSGVQFLVTTGRRVIACREFAAMGPRACVVETDVWDNRYSVQHQNEVRFNGLKIGPLGKSAYRQIKADVSAGSVFLEEICASQPAFFEGDTLIAVPHLGYSVEEKSVPLLTHRWLSSSKSDKKRYHAVQ